jgi:hypothetical protein
MKRAHRQRNFLPDRCPRGAMFQDAFRSDWCETVQHGHLSPLRGEVAARLRAADEGTFQRRSASIMRNAPHPTPVPAKDRCAFSP